MTRAKGKAITKSQTPQDAMTESDKQYIRTLGIDPETPIFDLFEQLEYSNVPMTSREAVNEHFAVLGRVLDICKKTAQRAFALAGK